MLITNFNVIYVIYASQATTQLPNFTFSATKYIILYSCTRYHNVILGLGAAFRRSPSLPWHNKWTGIYLHILIKLLIYLSSCVLNGVLPFRGSFNCDPNIFFPPPLLCAKRTKITDTLSRDFLPSVASLTILSVLCCNVIPF